MKNDPISSITDLTISHSLVDESSQLPEKLDKTIPDIYGAKLVRLPILLIFIFYLRPWEKLPILSVLHLSAVLSAGTIFWIFLSKNVNKKQLFECSTTKWVLFLFMGVLVCLPLTMYPSSEGVQNLLIPFSLFLALTAAVRSKNALIACLCAFLFCIDCHAASVTHSYLTGNYLGSRVTGFVGAEFSGANSLGAFFVASIPIAWFLWSELHNKVSKLFALSSLVLLLFGILSTQSRGGLIGLIMLIILSIFFSKKKAKTVLIHLSIIIIALSVIPKDKLERFKYINVSEEEMDSSSASRIYAWRKGIQMFFDHPIAGVGIGQFGMAFGKKYRDDEWDDKFAKELGKNAFLRPHNIFIQSLAETGGIGFLAFVMIIISAFCSAWKTMHSEVRFNFYSNCLIVSVTSYFVCMLFDHHAFSTPTYTLLALLVIPENIKNQIYCTN